MEPRPIDPLTQAVFEYSQAEYQLRAAQSDLNDLMERKRKASAAVEAAIDVYRKARQSLLKAALEVSE